MIPAFRLVPPGHTLVTLGERLFGGLARYYDRAPRGAPYFPRIRKPLFPDFSYLQLVVLRWNIQLRHLSNYSRFRNWIEVLVPKSTVTHTTRQMLLLT